MKASGKRSFDPEDGGDMFLRNLGRLSTDYVTLYLGRQKKHNHGCENLEPYMPSFVLLEVCFQLVDALIIGSRPIWFS
jgi:hypothetical protein